MDLNLGADAWAREIEEFNVQDVQYHGIDNWDMKNVVKHLEEIYECCERG
jgi:hypothetical protein